MPSARRRDGHPARRPEPVARRSSAPSIGEGVRVRFLELHRHPPARGARPGRRRSSRAPSRRPRPRDGPRGLPVARARSRAPSRERRPSEAARYSPVHADPRHPRLRSRSRRRDRAAAGAREPRARAARRDDDVRQPDPRQDDCERTARARAGRARRRPRRGRRRPTAQARRAVAAHVHGDSGLDGPLLPPPRATAVDADAVTFIARAIAGAPRPVTLVPTGPLTNIARYLDRTARKGSSGSCSWAARSPRGT